MRVALALVLFTTGYTTGMTVAGESPGVVSGELVTIDVAGTRDHDRSSVGDLADHRVSPTSEIETNARKLLGAANVVGGIWRTMVDRDHWRGLQLIGVGTQLMQGARTADGDGSRGDPADPTGRPRSPAGPLPHLAGVGERVRERSAEAAMQIRAGKPMDAIGGLGKLLDDKVEMNAHESARVHTLLALGHLAKEHNELAIDAMDRAVGDACSVLCSPGVSVATVPTDPPNSRDERLGIQLEVYQVALAAQRLIARRRVDRVVAVLTRIVDEQRVTAAVFKKLRLGGSLKQSRAYRTRQLKPPDMVVLWLILAKAHTIRDDLDAAIAAYEAILTLEGGQHDIARERLADLHLHRGNYGESLRYQRAWLRHSDWVGQACPKVCPGPMS